MRTLDPVGIASTAAALQLLPANGNSLWRLDVLASIASEHRTLADKQPLSTVVVDRLVNDGQLAGIAVVQEDPMDDLLCEELTFHGGSFLVGGGLAESSTFVFRALSRGFLLSRKLPAELVGELTACAFAAFILSDAVLRGAGLSRNVEPGDRSGLISIPDADRLSGLQRGTAFDPERLKSLLSQVQIEALEPLVQEAGGYEFSDEEIINGSGPRRPFLRVGKWLVLHRPFDVLDALRHHFSLRVAQVCGPEKAALAFAGAVEHDVWTAFQRMGIERTELKSRDAEVPFTEIRCRCDSDKEIVALILSDDFAGLEEHDSYTLWEGHEAIDLARARVEAIAEARDSAHQQLLGLIVMQSAGRTAMLLSPATETPGVFFEVLTAADLDTIGILETGDPLGLWKFAAASHALSENSRLTLTSSLDLYGTYRDYERSFAPLADATGVMIPPGVGGPYRREARAGRDRHGEPHPSMSIREVEREDPRNRLDRLIYHESHSGEPRQSIFVSGAPLALWVAGPERDVLASWDAVDTVAYWLSELTQPLRTSFERLSQYRSSLLIEPDFSPWEYWFGQPQDPGGDDTYSLEVIEPRIVRIKLGTHVRRLLLGADNAGDRLIAAALVDAVVALLAELDEESPGHEERDALVEKVAPLGLKKHLISILIEANPMMQPLDGKPRRRQETDTSAAEVDLAGHLVSNLGYSDQPVPRDQRNAVLNDAVAHLFERTRAVFEGVTSDQLLEQLVYANELLISSSQHSISILPARLATYPAFGATLRNDVSEANLAGICCRFLIEYAVACPPSGDAPWSVARYDEAIASVAELLRWADLSDAVRGGLTDVDLLIRDDGRLRLLEADRFDAGRGAFFTQHVDLQRQQASDDWEGMFSDSEPEGSETTDRINELMVDEAGVSLVALGEILVAANLLGQERGEDVICLPHKEGINVLAERLDLKPEAVAPGVEYLSAGPRVDFLSPPSGTKTDTYPWLFARRWSYNRRPFLRRPGAEEDDLLWGCRQVVAAMQILFGQLAAGQYQALAESDSLRKELGRIAKEAGAKFEEETLEVFRAGDWSARKTVRRLAGERLQRSSGQSLGDVDVLAGKVGSPIIWAVECKALTGSLSSAEVAREMSDHFRASGSSSVTKHEERVDWLRDRSAAAAELLGLNSGDGREVSGLIVTGREVMAPFIDEIPFEIVSIDKLASFLEATGD
ncbi:MAG: hypothetical protein JJE35_08320 [Thermoleophilia bacterium]|nr:hypothetical protein [Thermoleophilia bacterium]